MQGNQGHGRLFGNFLGNAALYGAGLILIRLGWLFLLPIYWSRLSPADYGIIGVAQLVMTVLVPLLSLGLHDALQRHYLEWSDEERPRYVAALWYGTIFVAFLLCILLDWAGSRLAQSVFEQVPFDPYLRLAIWASFFTTLSYYPYAVLRIRDEVRKFTLVSMAVFATQSALTIYLVVVENLGPKGYLVGILLNSIAWGGYFFVFMLRECRLSFHFRYFLEPLRYGLPTMPVAILDGTASLFDRFFLDKKISLAQLGIYNLANQIGMAFNLFNQMLKTSWMPFLYRTVPGREDGPDILGRFSIYYLAVLAIPALAVVLLSREFILFIGDPRYNGVYPLVPWFVLIYFIQAMAAAMGRGMDLAKRTALWPLVSIVGIAVSLTMLSVLVPRYGIYGALAALTLAAIARVVVQVHLAHRFYPRPLYLPALLRLLVICAVLFFAGNMIQTGSLLLDAFGKILFIVIAIPLMALGVAGREGILVLKRLPWKNKTAEK